MMNNEYFRHLFSHFSQILHMIGETEHLHVFPTFRYRVAKTRLWPACELWELKRDFNMKNVLPKLRGSQSGSFSPIRNSEEEAVVINAGKLPAFWTELHRTHSAHLHRSLIDLTTTHVVYSCVLFNIAFLLAPLTGGSNGGVGEGHMSLPRRLILAKIYTYLLCYVQNTNKLSGRKVCANPSFKLPGREIWRVFWNPRDCFFFFFFEWWVWPSRTTTLETSVTPQAVIYAYNIKSNGQRVMRVHGRDTQWTTYLSFNTPRKHFVTRHHIGYERKNFTVIHRSFFFTGWHAHCTRLSFRDILCDRIVIITPPIAAGRDWRRHCR